MMAGKFRWPGESSAVVQHFSDGARQRRQVALFDDEGWREVDNISKRFDPASVTRLRLALRRNDNVAPRELFHRLPID